MDDDDSNNNDDGSSNNRLLEVAHRILTRHAAVWTGLFLRLFLAWILPLLLDDDDDHNDHGRALLVPGVAYTDIDYHVFTDAAAYIQQGQSPYQRTTYRYTPFLASLLAWLPHYRTTARYLFCIADNLCGWIVVKFRRQQQRRRNEQQQHHQQETTKQRRLSIISPDLEDALWWLYNPLAINICTRGSAESLQVLLPVLLTLWMIESLQQQKTSSSSSSNSNSPTTTSHLYYYGTVLLAGMVHGVAMHSKIYPVIYTLSFLTALVPKNQTSTSVDAGDGGLIRFIVGWVQRILLSPPALLFGFVSVLTFIGLTWLAVHWYGQEALHEGLLYHFGRVDHRHNFSMHWYWIYLARAAAAAVTNDENEEDNDVGTFFLSLAGRLLFLPQVVLLVYSSLVIAPQNLSLALFVQTFLFVAHNKVITGQYFTWYLCLLPLCSSCMRLTRRVQTAIGFLFFSLVCWWTSAYCLEMQGMAVHRLVWLASVLFFGAQVNLLSALLHSTIISTRQQTQATSTRNSSNVKME